MEILSQYININYYGVLIFIISFTITYIMIPRVIGVIRYKQLMDNPNARSSHINKTPTLGGIAFIVSIILCFLFIQSYDYSAISFNIIAGLIILLIAGLKDDLVILSIKAKIFSQLLAITLLLTNSEIHIENFYGFLGLTEVPLWFMIGFSYFTVLSIINAYNLIDGIDGLASMLGILIFFIFGVVFYSLQLYYYFLLSVVPIGFLIAFLRYNLSKSKKIFMGDTGSMITGFLIGVISLRFLSLDEVQLQKIHIQPENLQFFLLAILFVMATDTVRVMFIRLLNKKGLFKPDRNHIHHILIDLGLSHLKSSIILTVYSVLIILLFYIINLFFSIESLIVVFGITVLFTLIFLFLFNQNYSAIRQKVKMKSIFNEMITVMKFKMRSTALIIFRMFF